jgi:PKD repeat protein
MKTAFHTLILFLIYSTNGFSQVVPCDASFTYTVSGNTVTVTNTSTGSYSDAYWSFGVGAGWTLASSNPMSYTYSGPGTYWVNLGLSDSTGLEYGCDSAITVVTIDSISPCDANFSVSTQGNTASFSNNSSGSNLNYYWDFGDGTTSTVQNPVHVYDSTGIFTVTLTASGICGSDAQTQTVTTQLVNTEDVLKVADNISVFPNPSNGQYTVSIEGLTKDLTLKIVDVQGRVLRQWQYDNPTTNFIQNIDISDVAEGIYFLQVQTADGLDVVRLIKQ